MMTFLYVCGVFALATALTSAVLALFFVRRRVLDEYADAEQREERVKARLRAKLHEQETREDFEEMGRHGSP
jgi:hypothetical protein